MKKPVPDIVAENHHRRRAGTAVFVAEDAPDNRLNAQDAQQTGIAIGPLHL